MVILIASDILKAEYRESREPRNSRIAWVIW